MKKDLNMERAVEKSRYIGGIFLVSGTTIGAGMLALPVLTGLVGLLPSLCVFLLCWSIMLATAFFFLDVNLAIGRDHNLISMSYQMLGRWGKWVSWGVYLLLLYSLTTAYLSASSPLFLLAIQSVTGMSFPAACGPFFLPLLFGFFVYLGTFGVDLINRLFMVGLSASYLILIGFLPKHIESAFLTHVDWAFSWITVPVVITSFGYHIIIPSLVTYMEGNRKALSQVLVLGSFFALLIYVLWQVVILGTVPLNGAGGLIEAWKRGESATFSLMHIVCHPWMALAAHFFSFFAIVTSFLGVTLSLSDFLTDGLGIKKKGVGKVLGTLLTFIPPMIFVFAHKRGFFVALEYAGAFVAVLLIIFPALMAWRLKCPKFYTTKRGKAVLTVAILFGIGIVLVDILQRFQLFKTFIIQNLE